jgi:hypothetical protein
MKQQLRRDSLGRILGKVGTVFFHNEDESWKDEKINFALEDIRFPEHTGKMHGDVITYKLSDLQLVK